MKILRTPDEYFEGLVDYPFAPHYTTIQTHDGSDLRIHHIDERPADGPSDAPIVLCMHGQPVWSYLYRKMIPYLTDAGMRIIAPDLVGYGKSDKPAAREDYSYERQVEWMGAWLETNDLSGITLFGQDWGGLIGLRLVVNHPERFDRVVISNTGLPYNPDVPEEVVRQIEDFRTNAPTPSLIEMQKQVGGMGEREHAARKFAYWQKFCWENEDMPIGFMMSMMMESHARPLQAFKLLLNKAGVTSPLSSPLAKAYDAPFPDPSYKMGPRAMPSYVPILPTSPSLEQQRRAWEFFETFEKPFLCAFADNDPVTAGAEAEFLERVPGTRNLPHTTINDGGHFVQELAPGQVSQVVIDLIRST
ncbi:MAG: haloalkane dehalogenase [Pseudomonadales bacterium]|nr:haloalkane dehalogenase [Pseudomonadales bacterium]MDP6472573.1 haloalkane dehalogenase [Pseudomonadales bacterium]MDP6829055.1 haloalkane dehalogenase [Pseudomonadales bacterium]MDP6971682.1 haloalkane dehalogenase [Pseudomonadales bacterium]